jgi:hypothetical protein
MVCCANEHKVLVGKADGELVTHTNECKAVFGSAPDLVAVTLGIKCVAAPVGSVVYNRRASILDKLFVKKLFAVPLAALKKKLTAGSHISGGAKKS